MGENLNPAQLTVVVDHVYAASVLMMLRIMEKYRTPQNYVQKFLLKSIRSDKTFAVGRVLTNLFTQKCEGPLTAGQLNKELCNEAKIFPSGYNEQLAFDRLLRPSDMSEVMRILEREGVLENITGKNEIKSRLGIRRGRRQKTDSESNKGRGGRQSVSIITPGFETVKEVMAKQEACDLLREKLLRLSITYKFEYFNLMALVHLLKTEFTAIEKLLRLVTRRESLSSLAEMLPVIDSVVHSITSLDNKQLEGLAGWSAETRPYDLTFVYSLLLKSVP